MAVLEAVKQYRRYLEDCIGTHEALKAKTCPSESDYEFWNQRNNPKFHISILFPILEDCDIKFIEFSYENQDAIIKENELYLTIAFSKSDSKKILAWFKEYTNLDFNICYVRSSPQPYDLIKILVKDIVDMIYTTEVEELRIYLEESSEQCEEDGGVFNYTEPPCCISYDGDWTFNEM